MTTQWKPAPASHAARTDVGVARDHNEDRYLAQPPLFVVADGLGGQAAGEVAAQLLVDRLSQVAQMDGPGLISAIESADRQIYDASTKDPDRRGMSTTCVALLLGDGTGQVSHVGDSRAYRLRGGVLARLTDDDSVVGELVRSGIIDEAQAEVDDRRHMLTQALGSGRGATVNTTSLKIEPGDRYLLCSDGLSGQVSDREIEAILVEHGDSGLAADELVRRSNAAGGIDNVTVIVVDAQVSERGLSVGSIQDAPASVAVVQGQRRVRVRTIAPVLAVLAILAVVVGYGLAGAVISRSPGASIELTTPLPTSPVPSGPEPSTQTLPTREPVRSGAPSIDTPPTAPSGSDDIGGAPG